MRSKDYQRLAVDILKKQGLEIEDLGEYNARTHDYLSPARQLINPQTNDFYLEQEVQAILEARPLFALFRKEGGWDDDEVRHHPKFVEHRIKLEMRLASIGYSSVEIAEMVGVSQRTVLRDGFSQWEKSGEIKYGV